MQIIKKYFDKYVYTRVIQFPWVFLSPQVFGEFTRTRYVRV